MTENGGQTVLLEAKGLSFSYKGRAPIMNHVDFALKSGEIVGLMGPSGCGKTTLFYCLSGIIPKMYHGDFEGQVFLKGKPLEDLPLARVPETLGMVFQNADQQLFSDHILDDIVFGPENLCVPKAVIEERLHRICRLLPVESLLHRKAASLSGGQKQMAAIAAVLAMEPEILFFDEAFAQLDEEGRETVSRLLCTLREEGCGILMIDHAKENLRIADRILHMEKGDVREQTIY